MSGNFNMKEWMHQNGQGPYKLHENYIDLRAIGSLKEKDEEKIEPDQKKPGKSDQEKPGRPPHKTSIDYWIDDKGNRKYDDDYDEYDKHTRNYDDVESGASLEEEQNLNEEEGTFDYEENCIGNVLAYRTTYKGGEIDSVSDVEFKLKFGLYIEARSYGIKSMDIVNLQGPSELDIEIEYYPQGSEDTATEVVTLPVDWSTVNMEKDTEMSYIGLSKNVDIELQNDSRGNLMIRAITVYYNSL